MRIAKWKGKLLVPQKKAPSCYNQVAKEIQARALRGRGREREGQGYKIAKMRFGGNAPIPVMSRDMEYAVVPNHRTVNWLMTKVPKEEVPSFTETELRLAYVRLKSGRAPIPK